MSVWLGDVARTIRDYLGIDNELKPLFSSRSLLNEEDPQRRLDVPLFVKAKGFSYHSGLAHWKRVNRNGTFAEYGSLPTN